MGPARPPAAAKPSGFAAVIFDCDGVLVDSEIIASRLWVEMAGELGHRLDPALALRQFKGAQMARSVAGLEGRLGARLPDGFVPEFRVRMAARLEAELRPVPGIEAVLAGLSVPFCVASNGPREKMDITLRVSGLLPWFEGRIFSAYEVGAFKPDPGLFNAAALALGAEPSRCAVVEDSVSGIRAGVEAGMKVFAYCVADEAVEHAQAGAVVFHDMADLPGLLGAG